MRKIIHVDMDAFYASIEQRDSPQLKGKPVVVGGSPEGRGVVASASYEARKFGIRSAMSARAALNLCPRVTFVRPNFAKYKEASRQLRAIFFDVTELVEPLSLDEAYLDVTENKLSEPSATRIAQYVRARIEKELGVTASAGVAPNKFLAKIASDVKKPNGLFVIAPHQVRQFVESLAVERLWGVGPATAKKLNARGFFTTADLRRVSRDDLERQLGSFGGFLHGLAHGEDPRKVHYDREPKSRGSETTFDKDTADLAQLARVIDELAEDVARSLAKCERRGHTVTLKIRYSDFSTITRSRTLPAPTAEKDRIGAVAKELLELSPQAGKRALRLLGISLGNLVDPHYPEQLDLDLGT